MSDCDFVEFLIKWWRKTTHDYPWRYEKDPFRVLLAEVLLQRTRRDKVTMVYERLLKHIKNPEDLASANPAVVREIIRPLGLAKRAEYLVRLAREYMEGWNLEKLTGVGPYTASVVRLITKGDVRWLVPDASIARVFSRFYGKPLNRRKPANTPWVSDVLNKCAPEHEKREYFLALIDLAWEICKPRKPKCVICPLKSMCKMGRSDA